MGRISAIAIALVMLPMISEAIDARPSTEELNNQKLVQAGQRLFLEKHCSHCHGPDGRGGVNLTRRDLSDATYVFEAISEGREKNGMKMPAWNGILSDSQIWSLTSYVMSISLKPE